MYGCRWCTGALGALAPSTRAPMAPALAQVAQHGQQRLVEVGERWRWAGDRFGRTTQAGGVIVGRGFRSAHSFRPASSGLAALR
ncbi:hypothetical protein ACRFBT_26510 [Pseudomonas aeruginosa]|uniref:hypothetical protein n=1 Tax=Pseudomonas aeruginosa TaxID=287 RepID=UPI003D6EE18A